MGNMLQKHKKEENFTCEICLEEWLPVYKKFMNECASSQHDFCIDCIAKYVQVKVCDYGRSVIKCPHSKCNVEFGILFCRPILSTRVFVRWCDLLCESEIQGKRVYCPWCSEVILSDDQCGGVTRRTTCPSCEKLFCFRCLIPLMEQKEKVHTCCDRNDLLFLDTVARKGWTRCPSCKQSVERVLGCNLVRCRCGCSFCYHCGLDLVQTASRNINHFKCYPRALELDPFMLRVHSSIYIGFAMMYIMGKPEFMIKNTNLYSILPASLEFGTTYVVWPKGKHQATVVWLHDQGANGFSWYQLLEALPIRNIKWICPTSPSMKRIEGLHYTTAWFNTPDFSEDMESLDASATHVSKLLSREPNDIKLGVGGSRMGSAIAMYVAACAVQGKLANGRPYPHNLSAVVGLSGWLPMARFSMDKIIGSHEAVRRAASLPLLLCHSKDDRVNSSEVFTCTTLFQKLTSRTQDRHEQETTPEEMDEVCTWLTTNLALDGSD